jgi:hypothetical protein
MDWMKPKSYFLTQLSILLSAPAKPAVYGLHTSDRWIFIGETENLRETLQKYLEGDSPWISVWAPTGFCFELWADEPRLDRKDQLVTALRPMITGCNYVGDDLPCKQPLIYKSPDTEISGDENPFTFDVINSMRSA